MKGLGALIVAGLAAIVIGVIMLALQVIWSLTLTVLIIGAIGFFVGLYFRSKNKGHQGQGRQGRV